MASDNVGEAWAWAALEPEPTHQERALFDMFCTELLKDGDPTLAASRCGFQAGFAAEYGKLLYQKSYVQRKLEELKHAACDPRKEREYARASIRNTLLEVMNDRSQRGNARVAAAGRASIFYGFDQPVSKTGDVGAARGGVILVPAIADLSDWEAAAQASQGKLAEASRVSE